MDGPSVDRTAGFEMGVSLYRWGVAAALLGAMSGCSSGEPATGASAGRLSIQTAPLTLPGVTDACFGLKVYGHPTQWTTETLVWQEATLCSSQFGDGDTSLTYVGTCNANGQDNTTELVLHDLYEGGDFGAGGTALSDYRNPCPSSEPCRLVRPCRENEDTAIEFNLVVLRSARQGFFDVAVEFEDIFCSAKVDCQSEGGGPLSLLHDPKNPGSGRHPTVVVGFACTPGPVEAPGEETWLYFDGPRIVCSTDGGVTQTTIPLGLDRASDGNVYGPNDTPPAPILQVASYRGRELLTDTSGASLGKVYANAALALDFSRLAGLGEGRLGGAMTASKNELPGLQTPVDTAYPFIEIDVPLAGAGDTAYACTQHPLDDPNAPEGTGVFTQYTGFDSRYTFQYALSSSGPEVELEPGTGPITGRLYRDQNRNGQYDAGEQVYAGVTVLLQAAGGTATLATAVTDAGGIYRFDATSGQLFVNFSVLNLAEAAYQIYVPDPSQLGATLFAENPRPVAASALGAPVDFPTLDTLATVTVTAVRDTDSSVVAGARVSVTGALLYPGEVTPTVRTFAAFTTSLGTVEFGLPPGNWTVRAYPHPTAIGGIAGVPKSPTGLQSFNLAANGTGSHTVRYIGGRSLSGTVDVTLGWTFVPNPFSPNYVPNVGPCEWRLVAMNDDAPDTNETTFGGGGACLLAPNGPGETCQARTVAAGCYQVDMRCGGPESGLPSGRWQRMSPPAGEPGFCFQQVGAVAPPPLALTPAVAQALSICLPSGLVPTVTSLTDELELESLGLIGNRLGFLARGAGQFAVRYDGAANVDPTTGVAPSQIFNVSLVFGQRAPTMLPCPGAAGTLPVCLPTDSGDNGTFPWDGGGESRDASGVCRKLCGNGALETSRGETCDTAIDTSGRCSGCRCSPPFVSDGAGRCTTCGDGVFQVQFEDCENDPLCQGCTCPSGTIPAKWLTGQAIDACIPNCGNGMLDSGEACDLGTDNGVGACTATCECPLGMTPDGVGGCMAIPSCGDGDLDPGESCDQGALNNDAGPGCTTSCECFVGTTPDSSGGCVPAAFCGDGAVDPGEDCDFASADYWVYTNCDQDCRCLPGTYENPDNYRGSCQPVAVVADAFWMDGPGSGSAGTNDVISAEIVTETPDVCPVAEPGCPRNILALDPILADGSPDPSRVRVEMVRTSAGDNAGHAVTTDPNSEFESHYNLALAPGHYRVTPIYKYPVGGVVYELTVTSLQASTFELVPGGYVELGEVLLTPRADFRRTLRLCFTYPDESLNPNPAALGQMHLWSRFGTGSGYVVQLDQDGCWEQQDIVVGEILRMATRWTWDGVLMPAPYGPGDDPRVHWSYPQPPGWVADEWVCWPEEWSWTVPPGNGQEGLPLFMTRSECPLP